MTTLRREGKVSAGTVRKEGISGALSSHQLRNRPPPGAAGNKVDQTG